MIKGHSKYILEFRYESNFFVKKSSVSSDIRLYNQAMKQKNFDRSELYEIPQVYTIVHNKEVTYFTMKYINAKNFIEYFNTSSLYCIDNLIHNFISIIEGFINKSTDIDVGSEIHEKYLNTRENIKKLGIDLDFQKIDKYFQRGKKFILPIGICHGDLTFSNILFDEDKLYLIDFLDSFIESPLLDIVKIRQDTKFNWSTSLYEKYFDKVKIEIILSYIDDRIEKHFLKYDFYREYYKTFEILNLLRVLQYATDEGIIEKLKKDIECVI